MKYVVANDPSYNFSQFGLADVARIRALDPGSISTFDGDFSAFRARGGKILSYHGRADDVSLAFLLVSMVLANLAIAHSIGKLESAIQSRVKNARIAIIVA